MPLIPDISSVLKVIIDVFNSIRGIKKDKNEDSKKLFSPKRIASLHLQIKHLKASIKTLKSNIEEKNHKSIQSQFANVIKELNKFIVVTLKIDINLIDLYSPSFGFLIGEVAGYDSIAFSQYKLIKDRSKDWRMKNSAEVESNIKTLINVLIKMNISVHISNADIANNYKYLIKNLDELCDNLTQIELQIGDFLKSNWTPKDLS